MRTCKGCGASIPFYATVDGVRRNLKNRLYCFICSPFGVHNTRDPLGRRVGRVVEGGEELVCISCGRKYKYSIADRQGHTRTRCNSCSVNKHKKEMKQRALEYMGLACCVCGYRRCPSALVFHHRDEHQKEFGIGGSHCRSWEKLKQELDKCVLLCANCHAEVHAGLTCLGSSPGRAHG